MTALVQRAQLVSGPRKDHPSQQTIALIQETKLSLNDTGQVKNENEKRSSLHQRRPGLTSCRSEMTQGGSESRLKSLLLFLLLSFFPFFSYFLFILSRLPRSARQFSPGGSVLARRDILPRRKRSRSARTPSLDENGRTFSLGENVLTPLERPHSTKTSSLDENVFTRRKGPCYGLPP